MLFWCVITGIVALVALLCLLPLWARGPAMPETEAADETPEMHVYRDQLAEIDRELSRGILSAEEAERGRIEISRKLLDADRKARADAAPPRAPRYARFVITGGVLACLAGAVLLYRHLGQDGYADQPIGARLQLAEETYLTRPHQAQAQADFAKTYQKPQVTSQYTELMEKLRETVKARPDDPRGLKLLARNEISMGNLAAGVAAQERLVSVLGKSAKSIDYSMLGEYRVIAAGGIVTPEAEAAFGDAAKLDPANGHARYYIGLMMAQNGRPDRTLRIWDALLRESTQDDDWVAPILANIPSIAWLAGAPDYRPPELGASGPSVADLVAAGALPPAERPSALGTKVAALQARMAARGGAAEDWATLIAGLRLLGETERMTAILAEARGTFSQAPETLTLLDQAASGAWPQDVAKALPGPTAEDIRNAQDLAPEDRQQMIDGMVDGLVERLESDGGSPAEWDRALRALMTLGQTARARDIYQKAQTALAGRQSALEGLDATAKQIGLTQ